MGGAGTPVAKGNQLQGSLENVNVQNVPGVGHITIDKNQIMQQKVISAIDAAVFSRKNETTLAQRRSPQKRSSPGKAQGPPPVIRA